MRNRILIIAGLLIIAAACSGCSSKNKIIGTPAETALFRNTMESGNYTIDVDMVYPASGRSRSVTSQYSLEVNGNEVISALPYFGTAQSLPYGGGEGLMFTGEISNYTLNYGKGGEADISFDARTQEDTYRFNITIYPNGQATFNVNPGNKQSIGFSGTLDSKSE